MILPDEQVYVLNECPPLSRLVKPSSIEETSSSGTPEKTYLIAPPSKKCRLWVPCRSRINVEYVPQHDEVGKPQVVDQATNL